MALRLLRRDAAAKVIFRASGAMRIIDATKRTVEVSLTSEAPVNRWGDQEVLSHKKTAVRLDRMREVGAFHTDHDTTKRVAAIKDINVVDGKVSVQLQFGRTQLATDAWTDVEDGILRGCSAGYVIHKSEYDQDTRTLTATDWEIYEGSFTTIPADPTVGVGRASEQELFWRDLTQPKTPTPTNAGTTPVQDPTMKYLRQVMALIIAYRFLESDLLARGALIDSDEKMTELETWAKAQKQSAPATTPTPTRSEDSEKLHRAELNLDLMELSRTHGVELTRADLTPIQSREAGLELILTRAAQRNEQRPGQQITTVTVTADGTDKVREAAVDGLLFATLGKRAVGEGKDLGMRRKTPRGILRALIPDLRDADDDQVAMFAVGRTRGMELRDANQAAGNFSVVLGNYADKAVMVGYNGAARSHEEWTSERLADDFKDVYGAAVAAGLLKEQSVPGEPADEMNLTEKNYNAALGLFMRTIKFTYQDWRNDNLGLFAELLVLAGNIASNTEEYQVYKALVTATWTNYVSTTAAFWDDTNHVLMYEGFGKTQGALEDRQITIGDETTQLNPVMGTILVPSKRYAAALAVNGLGSVGSGPIPMPVNGGTRVIKASWLSNSSLGAGYSADDYYLIARNIDGVKVIRDRLFPKPRVIQLDAGATLDQNYLVAHAFRAKLASQEGIQKGDWS